MPTLDWIGKKSVVNHHREVPYRLIHCDKANSVGDPDAGNLLVQGDNLEALKALLPYYAGKVKCIYIDPPYNTGNEGWVYNDNVNSPEIRAWLGATVGKEAEDLSRHDKWLCMMYPRLRLLKEFLNEDGAVFVSMDDGEVHHLRIVMDEIFGKKNFVTQIQWQKRYTRSNNTNGFTTQTEHIVVYSKSGNFQPNLLPRSDDANARYSNPDNDPRGPWKPIPFINPASVEARPNLVYEIENPTTGERTIPKRKAWRVEKPVYDRLLSENRLYWGKDNDRSIPDVKRFLTEVKDGITPVNFWPHADAGHTDDARREIKEIFGIDAFDTPKPVRLIQQVILHATSDDDVILDSFAGSGTTGHAALDYYRQYGRKRRFILIEMEPSICQEVTAVRLKRVIEGYNREKSKGSKEYIEGTGSGFRFCTLGEPLFDADGNVSPAVTYPDLAAHVFFCETGSPIPRRADGSSSMIGTFQGRAIYLLHSAEAIGVASANAGNVLTAGVLENLPLPGPDFTGARVVYAEGCTVPDDRLSRLGVTFKQIPYQIEGL